MTRTVLKGSIELMKINYLLRLQKKNRNRKFANFELTKVRGLPWPGARGACPVRARRLCRDTKERGALRWRPERPRPARRGGGPAARAQRRSARARGQASRPVVVRRSHVRSGARAPACGPSRAGRPAPVPMDLTSFCCK